MISNTPIHEPPSMPLITAEQVKQHLEIMSDPTARADYVAMIVAHLVNFPTGAFTSALRDQILADQS
jgi:hypothetical protein